MRKLSVILNSVSNNERFLNNLIFEIGDEITAEIKDNEILFYNIDDEKSIKLYKILAKNVLSEFEKKILVKIINKNCDYFSKTDKYEIWKMAMRKLLNDEIENNPDYISRVENVKIKLENFLNHSNVVSVEGFVNFRLKDFEDELEEIVEECVQDYLLELEYAEFINMLKYYLSFQVSKHLLVEVIYGDNVKIYGDGKNITLQCIKEFNDEILSAETNIDDFILNSLISIAPKRIVLRQKKMLQDEFKKTLLGVFGDKIKFTTE